MQQDVGIAERQKVKKKGRDDHIKQSSIQIHIQLTGSMKFEGKYKSCCQFIEFDNITKYYTYFRYNVNFPPYNIAVL